MHQKLLDVGKRFRSKFKKIDGTPFFGQILDIPDTSRVSNFLSAKRYLRTSPISPVALRDVIVVDGVNFIVAEHGTGFYNLPIYKHFKMFEIDQTAQWNAVTHNVDQVTGIKKVYRDDNKGIVYLSSQPMTDIEDSVRIQQNTRRCVCNKLVQVDDLLDDWIVTKVDVVLGVSLLEMKKK